MKTQLINFSLIKKISWLILFSIAMAYLETAVVVYLREIYYPKGFLFPLVPIESRIAITEFWREVATLIMLLGIGILTGKSAAQRFAFFLLSFAIWDIFYYVFLYVLLGWPSSLMTWDILFLVPVPWVGPVITPLIICLLMVILSTLLIYYNRSLNWKEWVYSTIGSLIVIISWVLDYWNYTTNKANTNEAWTLSSKNELFDSASAYIPQSFSWIIFSIGILFLIFTLISFQLRNYKIYKNE